MPDRRQFNPETYIPLTRSPSVPSLILVIRESPMGANNGVQETKKRLRLFSFRFPALRFYPRLPDPSGSAERLRPKRIHRRSDCNQIPTNGEPDGKVRCNPVSSIFL